MSKRDIAVLIAAGLLGGQVSLAAAEQDTFPLSDNETFSAPTPALVQYLNQRPAVTAARGSDSVFPFSAGSIKGVSSPDRDRYLAEQAKTISTAPATIRISAATRDINVEHLQKVRIENDKGQSFVWQADTLALGEDHFPLQSVAPNGFDAGQTMVFLTHPHEHMLHN